MMHPVMMTVIALLALLPIAFGQGNTTDLPHPVGVLRVTGNLAGHDIDLNGSAQEVYAQMEKLYPDFNTTEYLTEFQATKASRTLSAPLTERSKFPGNVICIPVPGQDWIRAQRFAIDDGIKYLDGLTALCNIGGKSCVRISCSYLSAIWLCNDNPYEISPTCPYMASYAQDLVNDCTLYIAPAYWYTGGQEFDTDGYNIIVRYDDDNC